jgi:hypothetical protein
MKIEFTKDELDYLACKIAEILRHRSDVNVGTSENNEEPLLPPDTPLSEIKMSTKLWNVIRSYGLQDWTPRDVAYYKSLEWARLRGLGRKSHTELRCILLSAGLDFGCHYFRRGENIRTVIIEKPTERYEGT